jgi:hypothetical protein
MGMQFEKLTPALSKSLQEVLLPLILAKSN